MSYSFAERLLEKVSPFFWSEEEGRLLLDAETLERSGDRYAKVYLALSMALLTFSAVSLGLLSNLMPVTDPYAIESVQLAPEEVAEEDIVEYLIYSGITAEVIELSK